MEFRRALGSPTWHFCRNCSGWPTDNFDEDTREPKHGLCSECTRKLTDLQCESAPEEGAS
ncbi:MAG TPA: hypothetical protein VJQ51_07525 [Burkholderiales bacterium]|nr:hypothetical protein [Burkholderiales bacterium]